MFAWLSVCSDILVRSNTKSTWEWEAVVHFWPSWNASSSEFAFPRASKFFFEQILTANCQHRVLFVIHPDKDHFFVVCGVFHTETQLWKRFSLKCCFDCFFSFSLVNRNMERIQSDVPPIWHLEENLPSGQLFLAIWVLFIVVVSYLTLSAYSSYL